MKPATPGAWPRSLSASPLLGGLDARSKRELEAASHAIELEAGQRLYGAAEHGDELYVVAEGELELFEARPGDEPRERVRRVGPGEHAGAEVVLRLARQHDAVAAKPTRVVAVPAHLFRRVATRDGDPQAAELLLRALRRSALVDLLATNPLGRRLAPADVDVLVDAAQIRELARGEPAYRRGDPSTGLFVVLDGLVQIQVDDDEGRAHVRAYLRRGDFFGDRELETATARLEHAVASGPAAVVEIPARVARRVMEAHGALFAELRRVGGDEAAEIVRQAAEGSTRHAFRDLYRLSVARSLLVIDQDQCVRCGHCTWACEQLHGVARMNRRGDKLTTRLRVHGEAQADGGLAAATTAPSSASFDVFRPGALSTSEPKPLLLPNSCQHCEHPACMIDCPTGAIGRDPQGEVFIRDALCTGCGACARACPWDNIQMSPRPADAPRPEGALAPLLATKCDLCRGRAEGPGCVEACPVGAIFRVDPTSDFAGVAEVLGRPEPASRRLGPRSFGATLGGWVPGSALATLGLGAYGVALHARGQLGAGHGLGFAAGVAAAVAMLALLAYAVPKRVALLRERARRRASTTSPAAHDASRARVDARLPAPRRSYVGHLALGLLSAGLVLVHAPLRAPTGDTGSVAIAAFAFAWWTGVATALAYVVLPRRLSRVEATAMLPEDHARAAEQLERRLYRGLSGRHELLKKIAETVLLPYARSRLGPLALLLSGRDLRAERERLRRAIERRLEGRGGAKLEGLDPLLRTAVEQRALPAQRLVSALLRGFVPLHVVGLALAVLAVAVHAVAATGCAP